MANLILTRFCNANCDYCFASDYRLKSLHADGGTMSEQEFSANLDFLLRSGIRDLRLLGGEPTLHQKFADFVKVGADAGCSVTVFTNGVMPKSARDALAAVDPEKCTVLVNKSAAITSKDQPVLMETLAALGPCVSLGITVASPRFSLIPLAALIEKYGLRKNIRLGLAHPTWGGQNRFLHPKRYPAVGQALLEQSYMTAKYGIKLSADCGFVRCMFGSNFEKLKENGFEYRSVCTPIPDICPNGELIPCFGLSNLQRLKKTDFHDVNSVKEDFIRRLESWHTFGIYPECSSCPLFRSTTCCGGCIAARLNRIQPEYDGAAL